MPKPQAPPVDPEKKRISGYVSQYESWRADLKPYWGEMDKWQEMYEFYKSKDERSETDLDVSLNTPFSIVESQIAKENQASVKVTVKAKPDNDIGEFDRWVESVVTDAMEDPDVAEIHGTFRKTREKWSRALKVVGNAAAEINYCYRTEMEDGKKKVVADNPYVKTRGFKSVIFNPAMQFDNSNIYYLEDFVDFEEDLKSQEYKPSKDKAAPGKGLYTNLGQLRSDLKLNKDDGLADDSEVEYISGNKKIARKNKPIRIITRWEGPKMSVIAITGGSKGVLIREATDPHKLGGHNLVLGMRYVVDGRPYAYGEIAAIYKPVRAQDTIVSQSIEIVNKYLRGSYILGTSIDIDQFMMVLANGGAMEGDASAVAAVPVNQPPAGAFQSVDILQQAIERAARYSPYSSGVPAGASDKTQGTASGIQALQGAAEPNVETQIDDIETMFMRPVARKYLKMIARLMGTDEVRYGLLQGENQQWVTATKGILLGKATVKDMVTVGLLTPEKAVELTTTMQPAVDPLSGQQVMQPVPIPGAEDAFLFDVDWVVDVKLDNQSAADKEQKTNAKIALIQLGTQMGVQFDPTRTIVRLAHDKGFEDIEQLLMTPEELQQQQAAQQQQMMAQQQQMMAQGQQEQAAQQGQQQADMAKQQSRQQHQLQMEGLKHSSQVQLKQVPQAAPAIA